MSNIGILSDNNSWEKYVEDVTGEKPVAVGKDKHDPLDDIDSEENEIFAQENKSETELLRESKSTATIIAMTVDMLQSGIFSFISGDESDKYKLSKSDREQYTLAWQEYLKERGDFISPGTALLLATLGILAPNGMSALKSRKEKKQLKSGQ
jgi:hypothetical protein